MTAIRVMATPPKISSPLVMLGCLRVVDEEHHHTDEKRNPTGAGPQTEDHVQHDANRTTTPDEDEKIEEQSDEGKDARNGSDSHNECRSHVVSVFSFL